MNFGDPRLPQRFWDKVQPCPMSGCWLWVGQHIPSGYGQIGFFKNDMRWNKYVHRYAYEQLVGPIPDGLQIDHKCRVTCCCNPAHLEPVTRSVNVLRGTGPSKARARFAAITHCPAGHEYNEQNTVRDTNNRRSCRVCRNARRRVGHAKAV